jgi:glycerol-3-phosphate acyltransferase PlsX
MLAIGCHLVKTFAGIDRPALCTAIPTQKGRCFLLDMGANVNMTAENLRQFAVMGSVLASSILTLEKPRVALLNIGEEDIKGTQEVKLAANLCQADRFLNYAGFIEADQIFFDRADVIVCDGFVGNIALKAGEGVARLIAYKLKSVFSKSIVSRFIAWLSQSALLDLQQQIDPSKYNGASFLGLQSTLVKSHGGATVDAYYFAIEQAYVEASAGVPELIKARLQHAYIVTPEV